MKKKSKSFVSLKLFNVLFNSGLVALNVYIWHPILKDYFKLSTPISPHYTVNNCYARITKAKEEWEKDTKEIIKIIHIGKANYGYAFYFGPWFGFSFKNISTGPFSSIERWYPTKVECPQ